MRFRMPDARLHSHPMSVAIAGKSPLTFEIKSASLPLLALRLKSLDLDALDAELDEFYGSMPDFFEDDPLVVDLAGLQGSEGDFSLDFRRLTGLLQARRLHLLGASGGSAEQMVAASDAGLLSIAQLAGLASAQATPQPAEAAPMQVAPAPELTPPGALVVDAPLRSGQQVYARGRDLVLRAMVNPGAEVIADGHVHVYAPLRGRAIAGARGWDGARIFATVMQPELVSIAGVYRTSEEPLPERVWGRAASVSLAVSEGSATLVFEPITD